MGTFVIDHFTNRYVFPNRVASLPWPLRRFLGSEQAKNQPFYLEWLEILVASFCGIAVIEAVFKSHTAFSAHHAPVIIASFGASAILCFNANSSPLAQPRNVIGGHVVSAVIGVCIQKLFSLSAAARSHYWAGGALSVAISSVIMSVLNCVHPPGGASALLPCVDERIQEMSWWYIPVQLVSSLLMLGVACLTGNIMRTYPQYWWTPAPCGEFWTEKSRSQPTLPSDDSKEPRSLVETVDGLNQIIIDLDSIKIPAGMLLEPMEEEWVESLQMRLTRPDQKAAV